MSFIQSVTLIKQDSASRMSPLERKKLKLIARVREQIELAENAAYAPMDEKRIKREDGSTAVIEVPKRLKRWWNNISARLAAEQGREVFAVPGSPLSPVSAGCNHLIREGATLVTKPEHMVDQLGPMFGFHSQAQELQARNKQDTNTREVQPTEVHWLIDQMGFEPVSVDELCILCERHSSEITAILTELELDGKVVQTAFGYQRCI